MNDISEFTNIGLNDTTLVSVDSSTKTNPKQQFAIINAGKTKQRPYDININKINKKAGKITRKSNAKYSDKQNFRIYKSKVAPNLYNKRMVDEEDDIVAKIKEAFGIEDKENTNFTNVETAQFPSNNDNGSSRRRRDSFASNSSSSYSFPYTQQQEYFAEESPINQISPHDVEELTGQVVHTPVSKIFERFTTPQQKKYLSALKRAAAEKKNRMSVQKDLKTAIELQNRENEVAEGIRITTTPIVRGNRVIGLDFGVRNPTMTSQGTNTEKRSVGRPATDFSPAGISRRLSYSASKNK